VVRWPCGVWHVACGSGPLVMNMAAKREAPRYDKEALTLTLPCLGLDKTWRRLPSEFPFLVVLPALPLLIAEQGEQGDKMFCQHDSKNFDESKVWVSPQGRQVNRHIRKFLLDLPNFDLRVKSLGHSTIYDMG
jgi:hypothetical protein